MSLPCWSRFPIIHTLRTFILSCCNAAYMELPCDWLEVIFLWLVKSFDWLGMWWPSCWLVWDAEYILLPKEALLGSVMIGYSHYFFLLRAQLWKSYFVLERWYRPFWIPQLNFAPNCYESRRRTILEQNLCLNSSPLKFITTLERDKLLN